MSRVKRLDALVLCLATLVVAVSGASARLGAPSSAATWINASIASRQTALDVQTKAIQLGASAARAASLSRSRPAALQACANRWNWMNYDGWFAGGRSSGTAPAKVSASPCRVEIAYRPYGSASENRDFLGSYFPCTLNRYGAYVCASHAYGMFGDPPRKGFNARYFIKTGVIRLNHPPARAVVTPKPDWVRRYRVEVGLIVPFDAKGDFRSGLVIRGSISDGSCEEIADTPRSTKLITCPASLYCFVPRLPIYDGEALACPAKPGSRVFRRGSLRVLPAP